MDYVIWKEYNLLAVVSKVVMRKVNLFLDRIILLFRFSLRENQIHPSK